jgi:hypothetical protein
MSQEDLARLHALTLAVPRLDDPIYKCEPDNGKLFTYSFGGPPDRVLSPEGTSGSMTIEAWPYGMTNGPSVAKTPMDAEECTRPPIPEGCLISESKNGQSDDLRMQPPLSVD